MERGHPSDLELFEYVEGELGESEAAAVRAHVDGCPDCAAAVADVERGRAALRGAPQLVLPEATWRRTLSSLGVQEAGEQRRRWTSGRLTAVLAPAAAIAAAIVATVPVVSGGDGDNGRTSEAAPSVAAAQTQAAGDQAAGGGAESGAIESATAALEAKPAPLRQVAGTPDEIAAELELAGFDATVVEGGVEVTGATAEALTEALEGRADGPVPVYLLP
jgi:anti-sigma factor RsiW